jgi:hypothetical protein
VDERVERERPPQRRVETRDRRPERPRREVERRETRAERYDSRDRRRGGTPWWVWLLGLAALGLIAFMIFQGVNDDGSDASSGTSSNGGVTQGGAEAGSPGTLVANGTDLLPLSSDPDSLGGFEGQRVDGTEVSVESVTGDETFWVGESTDERYFVFLNLSGESGPDIDPGDEVNLSGTLQALPVDFEDRFDLSSDEGVDQLEQQGRYLEVNQIEQI